MDALDYLHQVTGAPTPLEYLAQQRQEEAKTQMMQSQAQSMQSEALLNQQKVALAMKQQEAFKNLQGIDPTADAKTIRQQINTRFSQLQQIDPSGEMAKNFMEGSKIAYPEAANEQPTLINSQDINPKAPSAWFMKEGNVLHPISETSELAQLKYDLAVEKEQRLASQYKTQQQQFTTRETRLGSTQKTAVENENSKAREESLSTVKDIEGKLNQLDLYLQNPSGVDVPAIKAIVSQISDTKIRAQAQLQMFDPAKYGNLIERMAQHAYGFATGGIIPSKVEELKNLSKQLRDTLVTPARNEIDYFYTQRTLNQHGDPKNVIPSLGTQQQQQTSEPSIEDLEKQIKALGAEPVK